MSRPWIAIQLLAMAIIVATTQSVFACACAPHQLREDISATRDVYFARLVTARQVEPHDADVLGHYEVTFKVTERLKGKSRVAEKRELIFFRCAVPLVIGDEYVVFEREVRRTTRCWGSEHFDRSDWKADERRKAEIREAVRAAA